jgi:hypothetical protein
MYLTIGKHFPKSRFCFPKEKGLKIENYCLANVDDHLNNDDKYYLSRAKIPNGLFIIS